MTAGRRVVLVTGATRGIGLAVARLLAPSWRVLVGGTDADRVAAVVAELPDADAFVADLADADATAAKGASPPPGSRTRTPVRSRSERRASAG